VDEKQKPRRKAGFLFVAHPRMAWIYCGFRTPDMKKPAFAGLIVQ